MRIVGIIIFGIVIFFMGYYAGKGDGLYEGAIQLQTCQENNATGFFVKDNKLNCIF